MQIGAIIGLIGSVMVAARSMVTALIRERRESEKARESRTDQLVEVLQAQNKATHAMQVRHVESAERQAVAFEGLKDEMVAMRADMNGVCRHGRPPTGRRRPQ